jgi:hypothetical protein
MSLKHFPLVIPSFSDLYMEAISLILSKHLFRAYKVQWSPLVDRFDIYIYCDEMPESRNSGIESEVDFLGNELLRRLYENS